MHFLQSTQPILLFILVTFLVVILFFGFTKLIDYNYKKKFQDVINKQDIYTDKTKDDCVDYVKDCELRDEKYFYEVSKPFDLISPTSGAIMFLSLAFASWILSLGDIEITPKNRALVDQFNSFLPILFFTIFFFLAFVLIEFLYFIAYKVNKNKNKITIEKISDKLNNLPGNEANDFYRYLISEDINNLRFEKVINTHMMKIRFFILFISIFYFVNLAYSALIYVQIKYPEPIKADQSKADQSKADQRCNSDQKNTNNQINISIYNDRIPEQNKFKSIFHKTQTPIHFTPDCRQQPITQP